MDKKQQAVSQQSSDWASAETFLSGIKDLQPKVVDVPDFGKIRVRIFTAGDREELRGFLFGSVGRSAFLLERGLMEPTGDKPLLSKDQIAELVKRRNPIVENLCGAIAQINDVGKGIDTKNAR